MSCIYLTADVAMSNSVEGETMQQLGTPETLQVPASLTIKRATVNSRKATLQSCVDTIKEGFRKFSGCKDQDVVKKRPPNVCNHTLQIPERKLSENLQRQLSRDLEKKYGADVERKLSKEVERKLSHCHDENQKQIVLSNLIKQVSVAEDYGTDRKISFETYLKTIPRLDPVDRTIGWIVQQPDDNTDSPVTMRHLPPRGTLIPNPKPVEVVYARTDCESSISRCESARGTPNRGTPPPMDDTQPRLDEWLQELQKRHRKAHRRKNACANLNSMLGYQLINSDSGYYNPEITADILPFLMDPATEFPTPSHKNPTPYIRGTYQAPQSSRMLPKNHNLAVPLEYACEWNNCYQRFDSAKELFSHVESDHICLLPIYHDGMENELFCQWRGCLDHERPFPVRYKLLVHIQNVHCRQSVLRSVVSMCQWVHAQSNIN